jgi:putative ATP-dependent endonuclease of the OLD family
MKLRTAYLRNFRRLVDVEIHFEEEETIFVGRNNSGKTSAATAFRLFLARQNFTVHDFSASALATLNSFGSFRESEEPENLDRPSVPAIEMDLWFTLGPNTEYGVVGSLVPNLDSDLNEVGVRLSLSVEDEDKLRESYAVAFPDPGGIDSRKPLSHFLSLEGNLRNHFSVHYFSIERTGEDVAESPLNPDDGRRVIESLIRVDFVDAQRNIDDEERSRSNRLSTAFADFYRKNLRQAEVSEEANRVIDENNENLTNHYQEHFRGLMEVIQNLGVPAANDREMRVVSSMSPSTALKGNTSLLYVDPRTNHELPEAYNGLGFKNLIYMAIQISHFHLQWMGTLKNRPLCQLIFIEEPEVHLHAQVQQTFIQNIWTIVRRASVEAAEEHMVPQIGITTHSSHVLEAVDFRKVRFFRRYILENGDDPQNSGFEVSKVQDLRDFRPERESAGGEKEDQTETLGFLSRYLKLAHCDLFFADAALLVEGTTEKLLMPRMIEQSAPRLKQAFLTVLEVGGAYSHRFASLLEFLGTPYLVITDLDSVDPSENRKACRADKEGAVSSNASLAFFLGQVAVSDLADLSSDQQILADGTCFVGFQKPIIPEDSSNPDRFHGRTFEEAFVYDNLQAFIDGTLDLGIEFSPDADFEETYQAVFEAVRSGSFKKTQFALDIAFSEVSWQTPTYVGDGLRWLEAAVSPDLEEGSPADA